MWYFLYRHGKSHKNKNVKILTCAIFKRQNYKSIVWTEKENDEVVQSCVSLSKCSYMLSVPER